MSNVQKLPTAATSYYTVLKAGRFFDVTLVTPSPGAPLRTRLYRFADRAAAVAHGKEVAERMKRPFKAKEAAA